MGGLVACINTSIQHKKCTTTLIGAFGGEKDDGGRRSPSAEMRSRSAETRSRAADCIWISLVEAVVEVVEVAAAARIAQHLMHHVQSDLLEQGRRADAEGFTTGLNDRRP